MITNYLYAILSVVLVSLISFVGAFSLSVKDSVIKKYISFFISLAIGALLGSAFIHIIPESFESGIGETAVSLLVIGGILIFFTIEKFIHWHHHGEDCEKHNICADSDDTQEKGDPEAEYEGSRSSVHLLSPPPTLRIARPTHRPLNASI